MNLQGIQMYKSRQFQGCGTQKMFLNRIETRWIEFSVTCLLLPLFDNMTHLPLPLIWWHELFALLPLICLTMQTLCNFLLFCNVTHLRLPLIDNEIHMLLPLIWQCDLFGPLSLDPCSLSLLLPLSDNVTCLPHFLSIQIFLSFSNDMTYWMLPPIQWHDLFVTSLMWLVCHFLVLNSVNHWPASTLDAVILLRLHLVWW